MYCEDLDLSLRLRLAGWEVGIAPAARVEHAYDFDKGARKWFLLERNRWWTILADYPPRLLALLAPGLLAQELALLGVAARGRLAGAEAARADGRASCVAGDPGPAARRPGHQRASARRSSRAA